MFKDSLFKVLDSLYSFKTFKDERLLLLNKNNEKILVIYFSKIDNGKILKAEVLPYEVGYDEYSDTWHYGHRSMWYLFYFKKNKIVKVIRDEGWVN